ncbi:hypothetical protein HYV11_01265 [Candidatus Dependentiae bacterium]|nr:hypothetical protein [Candidatus Dependentiae bacterium]
MNTLKLTCDKTKSIQIVSDNLPIEQVYICYHLEMYWCEDKEKIIIGKNDAGGFLEKFELLLPLVLEQKLVLDVSIQKSLGFYLNEIFADRESFVNLKYEYYDSCAYSDWIGMHYFMTSTCAPHDPVVTTWMYNDINGDIVLEVTEMFSWSEQEVASSEEMDRYFEFLKNFKPILKQVIPKKVAEQWLRKAKKWYKIFYDNEQKACGR